MSEIEIHKRNFFSTAVADIYKAIDGKSYTGAFILTFCLIDHLAWLEFGHYKDQKEHFCKWIIKRLTPQYIFYSGHAKELYSVRCALVHTYGPSNEMIKKVYDGYHLHAEYVGMHLQKVNNNILRICLYSLLTNTVYAAHLFFEALEESKSPEIIERLNQQIKIFRTAPPELYKDMHEALSIFDNKEDVSLHSIRAEYTQKILYPIEG